MPLNHYITLGRSGLRVSPLSLGTMTFGEDLGWGSTVQEAEAVLGHYLDRGGNFLDTANVYTFGHSEAIIGEQVGRHSAKRDRVVIATKFFGNLHLGDPNGGGAGRKAMVAACEQSLRRLQTDYIDLYWMHASDAHTPIEETMRGLDDLVRAGKVRYIGVSDTPAWRVAQAQMLAHFRGWAPFVGLQIEYSLLERTVEGELVPMAQEFGLGITPWSPLKGGVLSGKYTRANHGQVKVVRGDATASHLTDKAYALIDTLTTIARILDTTVASVALAWVMSRPNVTSTIIGARNVAQLEQNLKATEVTLLPEHIAKLDALSEPQLNFPAAFLKRSFSFMHGGVNVNGVNAPPSTFGIRPGAKTY